MCLSPPADPSESEREARVVDRDHHLVRLAAVPPRDPRGVGLLVLGGGDGSEVDEQCPLGAVRDPHHVTPAAATYVADRPPVAGRPLQVGADDLREEVPPEDGPHCVDDIATAPPAQTGARPVPARPSRSK